MNRERSTAISNIFDAAFDGIDSDGLSLGDALAAAGERYGNGYLVAAWAILNEETDGDPHGWVADHNEYSVLRLLEGLGDRYRRL